MSAFGVLLPCREASTGKKCQIQTPRAYVFGRVIKVIFDRADDVYVDVERKFAEALVRGWPLAMAHGVWLGVMSTVAGAHRRSGRAKPAPCCSRAGCRAIRRGRGHGTTCEE